MVVVIDGRLGTLVEPLSVWKITKVMTPKEFEKCV